MAGDDNKESMGPIPAPVATRRMELNSGAKVRKLCVGGWRIQRCVGGWETMERVQSPAAEMIMDAQSEAGDVVVEDEVLSVDWGGLGIVAKACHSVSGLMLKRKVDVWRMFVEGNINMTSLSEIRVAVTSTLWILSHGNMIRNVTAAKSHSAGCFSSPGVVGGAMRVCIPLFIHNTTRASHPPKRCVRSNVLLG